MLLSRVTSKLRRLCRRICCLIWKRSRTKVIIRRFGRMGSKDRCKWKPGQRKSVLGSSGRKTGYFYSSSSKRPIHVATFNVAMFSLAPAIPNEEDESVILNREDYELNKSRTPGYLYPKSILKQSPLHTALESDSDHEVGMPKRAPKSKQKVKINLPENEISLAQSKFLNLVEEERQGSSQVFASRNYYRSGIAMRSPVCLPANMVQYGTGEDEEEKENRRSQGSSRSILEVLREVDADVLALQDVKAEEEKGMSPLSDLATALGMKFVFAESWAPEFGNAILSKWPIKRYKVQKIANDEDFRNVLKATIEVPWAGEVDIYCTQLDHLDENWRMKQINAIIESSESPHILAGGINSLDASDYSFERWMDIVKYYEDIGKPTPRIEVTNFLKRKQYMDAKEFPGECEPVVMIAKGQNVQGTCKYGTRVDYILASQDMKYKFVPGSYSVVSSKGTSDHHIVKVDITKVSDKATCGSRKNNNNNPTEENGRPNKIKQRLLGMADPCWAYY